MAEIAHRGSRRVKLRSVRLGWASVVVVGATAALAQPVVATGSYTGTGADNRAIAVGFRPDVVVVKALSGEQPVIRTSTLVGDLSKEFNSGINAAADRVQSLDANGFTLGTDVTVNGNGIVYWWVALRAVAGELVVGSYTGDGTDDRPIIGLGFAPTMVWTFPQGAGGLRSRPSSLAGDISFHFTNSASSPNAIQSLGADGFVVGSDPLVNRAGDTIHYLAWAQQPRLLLGTYVGDGVLGRAIATGFAPDLALVKAEGLPYVGRTGSPATDQTSQLNGAGPLPNGITALTSTGFQLGGAIQVNQTGVTYHFIALTHDAGPVDAGPPDSGLPDAGPPDAGPMDSGVSDAGENDAGRSDAGAPDAALADAGLQDSGLPDAALPDAAVADSGLPDGGTTDGGRDPATQLQVACGCSSPGGVLGAWALLMTVRRRRRTKNPWADN